MLEGVKCAVQGMKHVTMGEEKLDNLAKAAFSVVLTGFCLLLIIAELWLFAGCAASSVNDDSGAGAGPGVGAECVICMNDRVNAVLYRCGHLCMCFACAREMMNSGKNCPLCRQLIYDVIRCYSA